MLALGFGGCWEGAGGLLAEAVTGGGGAAGLGVVVVSPIHQVTADSATSSRATPASTTPAHRGFATLGRAELSTGMPVERRANSGSTARGTGRS